MAVAGRRFLKYPAIGNTCLLAAIFFYSFQSMKRSIKILLGLFVLLLLIGWHYWGKVMDKNIEQEYVQFYNTNLIGVIEKVGIKYHGTSLQLKGDRKEYVFYPYSDAQLNKGKVFENFAKAGDSVVKPLKSDTLILIKGKRTYLYTFEKDINASY
jgi:hypothetical protein